MNLVKQIRQANAGRDPVRLAMKYAAMRADAFAFLRGSVALWQARLPDAPALRKAPPAWACGDLHAENFGCYQGDNRQVYFDLNDFDEAQLAPASADVLRGLASWLLVPLRGGPDEAVSAQLGEAFVEAHAQALADGHPRWVEREAAEPPVRTLLDTARERQRADFLARRSDGEGARRRLRCDGGHALPAPADEHAAIRALLQRFAQDQPQPGFWRVLDVARRVAGSGSLGLPRWVVLVHGKGGPAGQHLLDLKAARPPVGAAAHAALALPQPAWPSEALRVVTLQRRMQAVPIARLHALALPAGFPGLGEGVASAASAAGAATTSLVLRGLQPREDRIALARPRLTTALLLRLAAVQGQCLAWAQLRASGRQGSATADALADAVRRARWRRELLSLGRQMASQTAADWRAFAEAYDDGAFSATG